MTIKRIARTNQQQKSEKPQGIGILRHVAVCLDSDARVQLTGEKEAQPLINSTFSTEFSQVPTSTTKSQPIMAKLRIGAVGDKYEREADRVAAQVVNQINSPVSQPSNQNLQREELPVIQPSPLSRLQALNEGMDAPAELESSIQQARSGGQPLPDQVRHPMERAFGADFSGVKVHTDTQADRMNQSIYAKAFTTHQDVFFRQGAYDPGSRGGQELLAHELTHVVQQQGAAMQRSPHPPQVTPQGQEEPRHKTWTEQLVSKSLISQPQATEVVQKTIRDNQQMLVDDNQHYYESVQMFMTRTGTTRLYRAIRTLSKDKEDLKGSQNRITVEGELNLGDYEKRWENLQKIADQALRPNFSLKAPLDWSRLLPSYQVSGEYATQYISTSKSAKGAAINTIQNWNQGSERTGIRALNSWSPIIKINLKALVTSSCKVYDMTADYIKWPDSIQSDGIKDNASFDQEVLIHGEVPPHALSYMSVMPGDTARIAIHGDKTKRAFINLCDKLWQVRESEEKYARNIIQTLVNRGYINKDRINEAIKNHLSYSFKSEDCSKTLTKIISEIEVREMG